MDKVEGTNCASTSSSTQSPFSAPQPGTKFVLPRPRPKPRGRGRGRGRGGVPPKKGTTTKRRTNSRSRPFKSDHLLASTITNKEIKNLWPSLDFVNCPTNSGVRNIDGITYEEVMTTVLNNLIPAEISESDCKKLDEKISKAASNSTLTAIDVLVKDMETFMHGIDSEVLVSSSRLRTKEFYSDLNKNITLIIDEQRGEKAKLGDKLKYICSIMVALCTNAPNAPNSTEESRYSIRKEFAHTVWKSFLIMLIEEISQIPTGIDANCRVRIVLNGSCGLQFRMLLDMPIDIDSRSCDDMSASTTNEESDASYTIPPVVRITSVPDGIVAIVPPGCGEEQHVIVVETKTCTSYGREIPQDNASGEGSPETHTSETQSQPQKKRRRINSQSEESEGESEDTVGIASGELSSSGPSNRMEQLCTQHFIELVGMMKDQSKGFARLLKCFGLYQVNHTVHITCLVPVLKDSSKVEDFVEKCYFVSNNTIRGDVTNKYKWRMVSTDCLNMLNPVHLKVLLRFLSFLIYHEYQYLRT